MRKESEAACLLATEFEVERERDGIVALWVLVKPFVSLYRMKRCVGVTLPEAERRSVGGWGDGKGAGYPPTRAQEEGERKSVWERWLSWMLWELASLVSAASAAVANSLLPLTAQHRERLFWNLSSCSIPINSLVHQEVPWFSQQLLLLQVLPHTRVFLHWTGLLR